MVGAPNTCGDCGRPRWPDERYCAGCGAELSEGSGVVSLGLLDLEDQPAEVPPKDRRAQVRRVIAAAATTLVLVITGAVLFSGTDAEAGDPEAEDETAAAVDLPVPTPLEATPTPRPRPDMEATVTAILGRDALREAQNRDENGRPIPAAVPDDGPSYGAWDRVLDPDVAVLADMDIGDGWLVLFTSANVPIMIDLDTGTVRRLEDIRRSNSSSVSLPMERGMLTIPTRGPISLSAEDWTFQPWSGAETVTHSIADESQLVGILEDPEHGPILLFADFGWSFVSTTSLALKFETGETRPFELEADLAQRLTPIGFAAYEAMQLARIPSRYVVGANGRVWSWGWDSGWTNDGAGDVARDPFGNRRILQCDNPLSCTHFVVTDSGDWLEMPRTNEGGFQLLSPNRERYLDLEIPTDDLLEVSEFRAVDVRSGDVTTVEFTGNLYGPPQWLSNSTLLIETPITAIVNVDTGVVTELPNTNELRYGTFWLPEVDLG